MSADLDAAKYVSFTTFKRDGSPVATAVWLAPFEGGYAFTTGADSYKVRRLRNNPAVTVAVCDVRGRVKPGTTTHTGRAEVLDPETSAQVEAAIKRKYLLAWSVMFGPVHVARKVLRRPGPPAAAVKFVLD